MCACAKRVHSLFVVKRDRMSMDGCACVLRLTFIRALEVEQGTVLSGQRTPFYVTFVTSSKGDEYVFVSQPMFVHTYLRCEAKAMLIHILFVSRNYEGGIFLYLQLSK